MDVKGRILVLENKPIEFEGYEEALSDIGIVCDIMLDADEFLDRVIETMPEEPTAMWDYAAASLDLKTKVPNRANTDATSNGGAWIFREVLRPNAIESEYLKPEQARVAGHVPVSFLTNYERDEELIRLHREYDNLGRGFRIIKKRPDVDEYVAWAEQAIEMRKKGMIGVSADKDTYVRYNDACLTVTRLGEAIGLSSGEIFQLLTGGTDLSAAVDADAIEDLASEIMRLYPAESALAPTVMADRWEAITQIISDTIAVFDNDLQVALRDLNSPLKFFEGQSALSIMRTGSLMDVVALLAYHEQRWGRA